MKVSVKDPFSDAVFEIDPVAVVKKCTEIYRRRKLDHSRCPHCPKVKELVLREIERETFLSAISPMDPKAAHEALEFSEMAKPWGKPLAGPTDTQPYQPVDPEAPMPDEVEFGDETGFAVVE